MKQNISNPETRRRIARQFAMHGVTIIDHIASYIEEQVVIGGGTVIEPGAKLLGATILGEDCAIQGDVRLVNVRAGKRCRFTGPLVIEDTKLGDDCEMGPFVQIKRSLVGNKFTAKHMCYLGDLSAGDNVNIGAGTITANWNGEMKSRTTIGNNCFIGVGTIFVAPVTLEDESGTAAGSVVTKDIPQQTLAIRRVWQQTHKAGGVKKTKSGWKIGKQAQQKNSS